MLEWIQETNQQTLIMNNLAFRGLQDYRHVNKTELFTQKWVFGNEKLFKQRSQSLRQSASLFSTCSACATVLEVDEALGGNAHGFVQKEKMNCV